MWLWLWLNEKHGMQIQILLLQSKEKPVSVQTISYLWQIDINLFLAIKGSSKFDVFLIIWINAHEPDSNSVRLKMQKSNLIMLNSKLIWDCKCFDFRKINCLLLSFESHKKFNIIVEAISQYPHMINGELLK